MTHIVLPLAAVQFSELAIELTLSRVYDLKSLLSFPKGLGCSSEGTIEEHVGANATCDTESRPYLICSLVSRESRGGCLHSLSAICLFPPKLHQPDEVESAQLRTSEVRSIRQRTDRPACRHLAICMQ